ncbi:MAG: hypothetical protein ACXWNL_16145 [Vulcanimicrobiaceae bacterium]
MKVTSQVHSRPRLNENSFRTRNEKLKIAATKNCDYELSGNTIKDEHHPGGQKAKANAPHDPTPLTQAARAHSPGIERRCGVALMRLATKIGRGSRSRCSVRPTTTSRLAVLAGAPCRMYPVVGRSRLSRTLAHTHAREKNFSEAFCVFEKLADVRVDRIEDSGVSSVLKSHEPNRSVRYALIFRCDILINLQHGSTFRLEGRPFVLPVGSVIA